MRQLTFEMENNHLSFSNAPSSSWSNTPAHTDGSMTEVIVSNSGAVQPAHLLPMLMQCSAEQRWLMWLSPHQTINKQWLEGMGLASAPVVYLDLCADTQLTLCLRVLASRNSHMIVEWQGELNHNERQQLEHAAVTSGTHLVLIQRRVQ